MSGDNAPCGSTFLTCCNRGITFSAHSEWCTFYSTLKTCCHNGVEHQMFSIGGNPVRNCEGVSRREWLRVGGLAGLSLADMLAGRAASAPSPVESRERQRDNQPAAS